ncbi:MAG TPA: HAD family hydrolase [Candidatus Lokiarchaeia archaeon]|nr:HAD family hydrolase [Candidatus Lokiarchaeia archaeon]
MFLDRDGTINKEVQYLHEPDKFRFEMHALEALHLLQDNKFKLIVVTNQAGIAKGLYLKNDVEVLHAFMTDWLEKEGIYVDGIYYCPHGEDDDCNCRKPRPGLIIQAMNDHALDPAQCWMIGDKLSDIEAGTSAGLRTILVLTGYGRAEKRKLQNMKTDQKKKQSPTMICMNLLEAAKKIVNHEYLSR